MHSTDLQQGLMLKIVKIGTVLKQKFCLRGGFARVAWRVWAKMLEGCRALLRIFVAETAAKVKENDQIWRVWEDEKPSTFH